MKPFIWRRTRLRDAANFRNLHCLKICKLWFSISLSQNWTEWPITHSTWPLCRSGGKQIIRHVWVLLPTQRIDRGSVSTNQTPAAIGENRSSVWCIIHPYLTYSSNGGFVPHTWKLSVLMSSYTLWESILLWCIWPMTSFEHYSQFNLICKDLQHACTMFTFGSIVGMLYYESQYMYHDHVATVLNRLIIYKKFKLTF